MNKSSKQSFFKACGGTTPLKFLLENRETRTKSVFAFEQPNILVGQQLHADIRIEHAAVGPRQLYLQLLDGRLFVVAFPGEKPTRWGKRVKTCGWLGDRESVRFGPFTLRVVEGLPPAADDAPPSDPMVSSPNGRPLWLEQQKSNTPTPLLGKINRTLTLVGNIKLCKLRLEGDEISNIHCSLVRAANGFWAVDLGTNGVVVNRAPASIALLGNEDVLEIGAIFLKVRYESAHASTIVVPSSAKGANRALAVVKLPEPPPKESTPPHPDQQAFERLIGPVLDRFMDFQNQTFQQFQAMLGNVMQMFGAMFQQQQAFVREEMSRYERLTNEIMGLKHTLQALPFAEPPVPEIPFAEVMPPERVAPPQPQPAPNAPDVDPQLHLWLQSRITELDSQRSNLWNRLVGMLRGAGESAPETQPPKL